MPKIDRKIFTKEGLEKYFKDIISNFRSIVFKSKNLVDTNYQLGCYHMDLYNAADAELRFRIVLLLQPKHTGALYGLAKCLLSRDKKDKALNYLDKLLSSDPENQAALYLKSIITTKNYAQVIPVAMVEEYFNKCANNYDEEYIERGTYRAPAELAEMLSEHLTQSKPMILDVGCGTGQCGQSLTRYFDVADLYGLDISRTMLDLASVRSIDGYSVYKHLYHGDYHHLDAEKLGKFDAVIASLSLQYESKISDVISRLSSLIGKGGYFAFSVEKSSLVEVGLNVNFENFCYNEEYLKQEIKTAGLKLIEISETTIKNRRMALLCICTK